MKYTVNRNRNLGKISPMIYGQFLEHFHRQVYGGVYDPQNPLSDAEGLRTDVLDAMRKIKVPIIRWPGGCFVSSYHWEEGVGPNRVPRFDKAWRVEDPNTFGTDEYVALCRKIGCEPYICTNAGTGTAEEMSNWAEYCNLENEGQYAKRRIANGHKAPHKVRYWSIGNENYGAWEIGAKSADEWGRLVAEAAKMLKHVDPTIELTAAALADVDWNMKLLKSSGQFLDWISLHGYWDHVHETNQFADYEASMVMTQEVGSSVAKAKGLLTALGMEKQIKIAFDEWNLREWYHPNVHTVKQGRTKEEYLYPRDKNDDNTLYTMADAVFSACFLNMCGRNCDIVGMANFAPIVNTRGAIFTYDKGIVLRSTYHVFDLYVNYLGDTLLDGWLDEQAPSMQMKSTEGKLCTVDTLDILPTCDAEKQLLAIAVVNKSAAESQTLAITDAGQPVKEYRIITVNGDSPDAYNDIGHDGVTLTAGAWQPVTGAPYVFAPHSVNVLQLR